MREAHRSIGEVLHLLEAEFPDVTISKIRFLESQGLLNPERTPSGYRKFRDDDVDRLRWILVQQRDNFLPLRVIKMRLETDDWSPVDLNGSAPESTATAASGGAGPSKAETLDLAPSVVSFTVQELSDSSGLDISEVRELQKYGILEPITEDPAPLFDDDALVIARAASAFMGHGVEPRHLKAWKIAAEREAGILEQLTLPLVRQGSASARTKSIELASELVDLGGDLRYAMLRRSLRSTLGGS